MDAKKAREKTDKRKKEMHEELKEELDEQYVQIKDGIEFAIDDGDDFLLTKREPHEDVRQRLINEGYQVVLQTTDGVYKISW
jgi:hypothetical protein